jgi:alkylhydroperoxidase family enzyme
LARRETTEAELARVDRFESEGFAPAEKAVLRFTEAFYRDHRAVPDAVWEDLRRHYGEPEIIELAWTVAAYIMLGKLIHAFRIPYEDAPAEART